MAFEIAKAGWLHRQSTVLKRWKRSWVVIYQDGHLKYFVDPNSCMAEEAIFLPIACEGVISAKMVHSVDPPAGMERKCLFQLRIRGHLDNLTFCADTTDDLAAWEMSLEQARAAPRPASVMHTGVPGQTIMTYSGQTYPGQTYPSQGQTIVTYPNQTTYVSHPRTTMYSGGSYPGQVLAGPGQQTVIIPSNGTTYGSQQTVVIPSNGGATYVVPGGATGGITGNRVIIQGAGYRPYGSYVVHNNMYY